MSRTETSPLSAVAVATLVLIAVAATRCGPAGDGATPADTAETTAGADATPQWRQVPENAERVRLCLSGAMLGRMEPCSCASGQLGGLPRRMFHIARRTDYDILIEGGDIVSAGAELDFQKFFTTVEVLYQTRTPYHVLGVGPRDLLLEYDDYTGLLGAFQVPLVASDLQPRTEDPPWPGQPWIEREVRGTRVRIASLTGRIPEPATESLELLQPAAAWRRALEGADDATLRVLLVHDDPDGARRLAGELQPPPDLVVGIGGEFNEPPATPERVGKIPVVFPGIRGRVLLDITLARLPDGPRIGYHTVPLEGSATAKGAMEDPTAKQLLLQHRHQVKEDGVLQKMAEQRPTKNGAAYVGTDKCAECHEQAHQVWQNSRHGRAWQTLVAAENDAARYGWPVTAYPDCVSCHTVGYGDQSGFVDMTRTPHLADVGCENCHGAGGAHAADPDNAKIGKVGGELPASTVCTRCHDFEQSPDFDYAIRWPAIQHGAK